MFKHGYIVVRHNTEPMGITLMCCPLYPCMSNFNPLDTNPDMASAGIYGKCVLYQFSNCILMG